MTYDVDSSRDTKLERRHSSHRARGAERTCGPLVGGLLYLVGGEWLGHSVQTRLGEERRSRLAPRSLRVTEDPRLACDGDMMGFL